jgi:hypothetical protein
MLIFPVSFLTLSLWFDDMHLYALSKNMFCVHGAFETGRCPDMNFREPEKNFFRPFYVEL